MDSARKMYLKLKRNIVISGRRAIRGEHSLNKTEDGNEFVKTEMTRNRSLEIILNGNHGSYFTFEQNSYRSVYATLPLRRKSRRNLLLYYYWFISVITISCKVINYKILSLSHRLFVCYGSKRTTIQRQSLLLHSLAENKSPCCED